MKAITLSWDEVEAWFNGDNKDRIMQVFQECVVQTNRSGDHFWTENYYRYRILYNEKPAVENTGDYWVKCVPPMEDDCPLGKSIFHCVSCVDDGKCEKQMKNEKK